MEKIDTKSTGYTYGSIRRAQDMAADLGHLNRGISSLINLYATAPELLEALKDALDIIENLRTHDDSPISYQTLEGASMMYKQAIAKAEAVNA